MVRRGFTLVELLVVLLILGVLVGLAVPRYMQSTKTAKRTTFETNLKEITKALEDYKLQREFQGFGYPPTLESLRDSGIFNKEPINPYTGKSMLSSTSTDSGLLYQSTGPTYKLCVVQRDIEDVNNNGIVDEVLPLTTKSVCIGDMRSNIQLTFIRPSVAYTSGGTQVGANVPRFEAGKFGQAIMVEEGTTNKIETEGGGASKDWSKWSHWGIRAYWQGETQYDDPVMGKVFQGVCNNPTYLFDYGPYYPYSITLGGVYTVTIWLKASVAVSGLSARAYFVNKSESILGSTTQTINLTTKWQKFEWQITATATDTVGFGIGPLSIPVGTTVYAARPQLEQKPYATSWTDGTRQPEILKIPTNIVTPTVGTVSVWVNVNDASKRHNIYPPVYPTIFSADVAGAGKAIWLYHRSDAAKWRFQIRNESGSTKVIEVEDSITPNGWHHFAITWSANKMVLYIDGIKRGEQLSPPLPSSFIGVYVGCWETGANQIDTVLDDFALYNRQLSDNEVQAIYNSGQPAPVDANTILKADFDGNLDAQSGIIQ